MKLTKQKVKSVLMQFYDLNASRAPIVKFVPLMDIENFLLAVKGTDIAFHGIAGFADHQMGKLIYFDQVFTIEKMNITIQGDHATANTQVIWQARHWQFPAPYSELIKARVVQTWQLKQSSQTGLPIITSHIAKKFSYLKGFAPKVTTDEEFHLTLGHQ